MVRQRGKAMITIPSTLKTKITTIKDKSQSHAVLQPIILLSLLVGHIPTHYKVPGIVGGLFWFVSLFLHTAFDFMSARKMYGYAWAFIQIMLFANLAMCTYSARSKTVPWLEMSLFQLDKEKKYHKTFARIRKLFRAIPLVVLIFSFAATGLQFFCFHYDGAFSVSFEQQVSSGWRITLLVVWFLTNVHILYAFAFFWCITMCNMYTTGYSMTEYHEIMTAHLKNKDTPVTFRQAVHSFAERGTFLKKSASACRISLAFLVVFSIASLAVNAFYYLYKSRKAAYIFSALMPPICSVYPLCLAAWVTKQYQFYLTVVVKAWAERPESSDDEEESGSDQPRTNKDKHKSFARKLTKRVKSAGTGKKDAFQDGKPRRTSLFFRPKSAGGGSYSDTEGYPEGKSRGKRHDKNDGKPRRRSLFLRPKSAGCGSYSDTEGKRDDNNDGKPRRRSLFVRATQPKSSTSGSDTEGNDGKPRRRSLFERAMRTKPSASGTYSDTEVNPEVKSAPDKGCNDNDESKPQRKQCLRATRSSPSVNGSYSDTEAYPEKKVNFAESPLKKTKSFSTENTTFTSVSDTEVVSDDEVRPRPVRFNDEHKPSTRRLNDKDETSVKQMNRENKKNLGELNVPTNRLKPMTDDEGATDDERKPNANDEKGEQQTVNRKRVMEIILRGTARAVGRLQRRAKMPKFNFEKYIVYLQNVLPTVGFKIMGITVTWEMVSTILFLEVSLLALFMQESIFGDLEAKVSL